jgi:phosphatidylinositol-3-phosphatase
VFRRLRVLPLLALVPLMAMLNAPARATAALEGVPAFGHVFVIIGENTSLSDLNKTNAPFQLGTVMPNSAWLTNYWAASHYSTSNYVAMTSGQYISCEQADAAPASCNQDVPNLFRQLDRAGVSWQEWNESMPGPCYLPNAGSDKTLNKYRVKHNPAAYYANIEGAGGVWSATTPSAECINKVISTGGTGPNDTSVMDAALATGKVGRFNFIVPNECEDGHDNCAPIGNNIAQFDAFLAREVPKIEASPAFGTNGIIVIVYDEGQGGSPNYADKQPPGFGGGNVLLAVMGPLVHPAVYPALHNHYGLLRTLEDGFGISHHVAGAGTASVINEIWK